MTLEPGTYWIDLPVGNPESLRIADYVTRPNANGHTMHSVTTQRRGGFDVMIFESRGTNEWPFDRRPTRGFEGMSPEDTVSRPDPIDAGDVFDDMAEAATKPLLTVGILGAVGLGAYWLLRRK